MNAFSTSFTAEQHQARLAMHRHRKRVNAVALMLAIGAMAFGVFWLLWILFETFRLGLGGLNLAVFTEMTPPPQADTGGLANAIFGSVVMAGLATLLGTPIGVMAGIYLAEYGQKTWLGSATSQQRRHVPQPTRHRRRPPPFRSSRRRRRDPARSHAGRARWRSVRWP